MTYACAFCGEENDTFVDPSGGTRQVYTEDCAACRRPTLTASMPRFIKVPPPLGRWPRHGGRGMGDGY
jgi:hypothetical protein